VLVDALLVIGPSLNVETLQEDQKADMQAFIAQQLPRLAAWAHVLRGAVQAGQQVLQQEGAGVLPYRSATAGGRKCAQCGVAREKLLTCKSCGVAVYCGRDCQVSHWLPVHKAQCKLLRATPL
jgi:hypothetical protein